MKKSKKRKKRVIKIVNKKRFFTCIFVMIAIFTSAVIGLINCFSSNKESKDNISIASSISTGIQDYNDNQNNKQEETNKVKKIDNKGEKDETEISIESLEEENLDQKRVDKDKEKNNKNVENTNDYYIKVNNQENVVTIYKKDEGGKYTLPVKAMVCSTGSATPTSGCYKTSGKWRWIALFGNVYGQYSTRIVGNILFHSVPYLEDRNPGSLEYWEYDKLGTSASMGCVRLKVIDAKWIYDNIPSGTIVEFYSDSDPGPLGKPSFKAVSDNTKCRDWDPTDPNPNNPWNSAQQYEKDKTNDITTNNI